MDTWQQIAEALQVYREKQRATWGDVDDVLIAKYLLGDCHEQQRRLVEHWMVEHPALAELGEVLRPILLSPLPEQLREAEGARADRRVAGVWLPRGRVWELVEKLAAWVDAAGKLVAEGIEGVLSPEQLALHPHLALGRHSEGQGLGAEKESARWSIPLSEEGAFLEVSAAPAGTPGRWALEFRVTLPGAAQVPGEARLDIYSQAGQRTFAGPLLAALEGPVTVAQGAWRIQLELGGHEFWIPVELGSPPAGPPA